MYVPTGTTCPKCGGRMLVPQVWHGVVPPKSFCENGCNYFKSTTSASSTPNPPPAVPTK